MKKEITRQFLFLGRHERTMYFDDEIELAPREYYGASRRIGFRECYVFDILTRRGEVAGEIALRIGDSPAQFYLGHIGYHVDPPFQGHSYALRACRLCLPMLRELDQRTFVITTDPDNAPSIRTCERLGCEYEGTVNVPDKVRDRLEISAVKRRYVFIAPAESPKNNCIY